MEHWTSLATALGALAFFQTILHSVLPPELRFAALKLLHHVFHYFTSYYYFDITENDGVNTNELYDAVQLYLSNSASIATSNRVNLTRPLNSSALTFGLAANHSLADTFGGATAWWEHVVTQRPNQSLSWRPVPDERRGFTLRIRKKDRPLILDSYLNHIMETAGEIRRRSQDRLLYTNSSDGPMDPRGNSWDSVPFKHPSTFDTLAIDPMLKEVIIADLSAFAEGQDFYLKTGRAWKRGYLLYGPPGTGKSSMIAAMANYLGYDIYDLELTQVNSNSELRKLLMRTTSKSIIVIEDIDCSVNLGNRNGPKKHRRNRHHTDEVMKPSMEDGGSSLTLSGLLNFTDGLWSCCSRERIFVFTTNHIEKLDPALLRSGRMDMHIHMTYCTYPALKILVKNYLGVEEECHSTSSLMNSLKKVVDKAEMTPADVSEVLIKNRLSKEKAMMELLDVLKSRVESLCQRNIRALPLKNLNADHQEQEEQEKRALESPIDENGFESLDNYGNAV